MAFAGFIFAAGAQETPKIKHLQHHQNRTMMMKELNLSAMQKEQLKATRESYKKQLIELNKNESITVGEARDRKEALRKQQKEKMMSLLTTEQKNQLAQLKKEKLAKRETKAAKRLDKMKTNLNLSDGQVAKIKTARQATQAQLKAIKENDQLSRTQRKEQLMALKEQTKNSFKSILTPEQLSKMDEMKKTKMGKRNRT
jgi:Spy/CpxP family protein refolding chaperone